MAIDTSKDYYVPVVEFDCTAAHAKKYDDVRRGPLSWEVYLDEWQSLEQARENVKRLDGLGEVRIAKLQFVD